MARGAKTGGRTKGTPNKITKAVRHVIDDAASALGGTERLVEWAKEDPLNERAFWASIYPKLLPLHLEGNVDTNVTFKTVYEAPPKK